jgi:hypothetical protein
VRSVEPEAPSPFSETTTRCVTDTLRFAEFPAHDLPDGFSFDYPLTYSP